MLVDIRPRTRKPFFGSVDIDWAHPLASGLMGGVILNEGGGRPFELINLTQTILTPSRPSWRANRALFFDATNTQAVTVPMKAIPTNLTGQSWAFAINVATQGGANTGRIFTNGTSDNANPQIQWQATGLGTISIGDHRSLADATCMTSGANIVANTDCHIVVTDDINITLSPGMFKAYFNGVSSALTAGGNGLGTLSDPTSWTLGGLASLAARSIDGVMYYFYKYGRILSQSDALWLQQEPYAFLRPRPAIWYSFSATTTGAAATRRPPSLALTGVGI